ncbi:uncharacterized protein THITE_109854 [Thermothielavioides terrestris NRRL 8126]|uniref:Uncharacterized protein n=1 Tax=Thermothielavioides terrestris (strain ATCC 38088 / NRRL 8126) TaxID=578455 RepID=G2R191_THETT|nr:uncharacterized protein THITE_109854 [Thermothielavioides terrestris NRRL 8126]AEO67381.1 hypothetical protein THITE_109854 [Thermothielavioides terrestris NRRL 8126]
MPKTRTRRELPSRTSLSEQASPPDEGGEESDGYQASHHTEESDGYEASHHSEESDGYEGSHHSEDGHSEESDGREDGRHEEDGNRSENRDSSHASDGAESEDSDNGDDESSKGRGRRAAVKSRKRRRRRTSTSEDERRPDVPRRMSRSLDMFVREAPKMVSQAQRWMAKNRRPIAGLDQVKELLPRLPLGDMWTAKDRAHVERLWDEDPMRERLLDLDRNKDILTLYKACLRLLRCLPEDIISCQFDLEYDTDQNRTSKTNGRPGLVWSATFCDALTALIVHPLFEGEVAVLAAAIQYAVIVDTGDPGPFTVEVPDDHFLSRLQALQRQQPDKPVVELRRELRSARQPNAFGFKVRGTRSSLDRLFEALERLAPRRDGRPEARRKAPQPFLVDRRHLAMLQKALDSMAHLGFPVFMPGNVYNRGINGRRAVKDYPQRADLRALRSYAILRERERVRYKARLLGSAEPRDDANTAAAVDSDSNTKDGLRRSKRLQKQVSGELFSADTCARLASVDDDRGGIAASPISVSEPPSDAEMPDVQVPAIAGTPAVSDLSETERPSQSPDPVVSELASQPPGDEDMPDFPDVVDMDAAPLVDDSVSGTPRDVPDEEREVPSEDRLVSVFHNRDIRDPEAFTTVPIVEQTMSDQESHRDMAHQDRNKKNTMAAAFAAIRDCETALALAHAQWPEVGSDPESKARESGVACAVIVLRHVLANLVYTLREEFLDDVRGDCSDSHNVLSTTCPLLAAALALHADVAAGLCTRIQNSLSPHQLTFESLMTSDSMQAAAWSSDCFRFFNESFWRVTDLAPWRDVPGHIKLPTDQEFLTWDGSGPGSLSDHVSRFSHLIQHIETGYQLVRFVNAPPVLRLRFSTQDRNLSFYGDLFEFRLRLLRVAEDDPAEVTYRCVAVVRLRDAPDGQDSLRLYRVDGSVYQPRNEAPWSHDFRVQDGGQYMLFFVRSDALPIDVKPLSDGLYHPNAEYSKIALAFTHALVMECLAGTGEMGDTTL